MRSIPLPVYLFVFLCSISGFLQAQSFEDLVSGISGLGTKSLLEQRLKEWTRGSRGKMAVILERELDFECRQSYWLIQTGNRTYDLDLLTKGDNLLYVVLKDDNAGLYARQKELFLDRQELQSFLVQHNLLYQTHLNLRELTQQLSTRVIFGFGCGLSGRGNPPQAALLTEAVAQGRKKLFDTWIRSANSELQAYGASGLIALQQKGLVLTAEDRKILDHLMDRNPALFTCSGCMVGIVQWYNDLVIRP